MESEHELLRKIEIYKERIIELEKHIDTLLSQTIIPASLDYDVLRKFNISVTAENSHLVLIRPIKLKFKYYIKTENIMKTELPEEFQKEFRILLKSFFKFDFYSKKFYQTSVQIRTTRNRKLTTFHSPDGNFCFGNIQRIEADDKELISEFYKQTKIIEDALTTIDMKSYIYPSNRRKTKLNKLMKEIYDFIKKGVRNV